MQTSAGETMTGLARGALFIILCGIGALLSLMYLLGDPIPIWLSMGLMTTLAGLILIGVVKCSPLSILPRLFTGLYILPFMLLWGYVFKAGYVFYSSAALSLPYQQDLDLIARLALVGLLGLTGLAAGFVSAGYRQLQLAPTTEARGRPLGLLSFVILLGIAFLLSWIYKMPATILSARYTEAGLPLAIQMNFGGAYVMSFVLIAVLIIDFLYSLKFGVSGKVKIILIATACAIIVIYIQLMSGKREALGLILSFVSLYMLAPCMHGGARKIKFRYYIIPIILLGTTFVTFKAIGYWRSVAVEGVSFLAAMQQQLQSNQIFHGTWTSVLLTPLSAIWDLGVGNLKLRWGQTYLDLLLSLPPGIISKSLGYVRPFEGTQGLAWEMTFGEGGTHISVAPLLNFSAPGLFVILLLLGYFFGRVEQEAQTMRLWPLLLHSALVINSWGFFWYGEMYGIRSIMAAVLAWMMYRAFQFLESKPQAHPAFGTEEA